MKTIWHPILIGLFIVGTQHSLATTSLEKLANGLSMAIASDISENELSRMLTIEQYRSSLTKDKSKLAYRNVATSAHSSVKFEWGSLLFCLVKAWNPRSVLEIGTCIGISSSYLSCALESNGTGQLVTLEYCPLLVPFIEKTWKYLSITQAEVRSGAIKKILEPSLKDLYSIDMVFDDENHHEKPTINKFNTIIPFLSDSALYIFDDITYNEGMKKAWEHIKNSEHIAVAISVGNPKPRVGICVIDHTIKNKQLLTLNLKKAKEVKVENDTLVIIN